MLEQSQTEARERAQQAAQETATEARTQLGRRAFDALEEYFPEEAEQRQQNNRGQLLAVGFAIGFVLGILVGR
ncbi:hypothetical protein L593_14090 [Salinarchaeum sp. Harcht-Bsk1]|uniref:hypothetical protein n=1 Tax=Salinarchaeum sp. Harcht-Bsk1 TaxID=1333523 RepID=UPI00034237AC|nr:hypothetical protein [Salinarchaeum sp. Harcht-Bsk1]AGN02757.1 hypothetical protein L593_14090 [Salinarchaeum sp. Harcht-Bsk1]